MVFILESTDLSLCKSAAACVEIENYNWRKKLKVNFLFLQAPLLVSACVGIGPVGNTSPSRSSPSTTWSGSSRSNMSRMRNPSWRYPTIFKISQYMNKQMSKKCAFLSRILILFLCFASSPNLQIYFQKCQSNFQVFKAARLSLFPREETLDGGHIMHFGGAKLCNWAKNSVTWCQVPMAQLCHNDVNLSYISLAIGWTPFCMCPLECLLKSIWQMARFNFVNLVRYCISSSRPLCCMVQFAFFAISLPIFRSSRGKVYWNDVPPFKS